MHRVYTGTLLRVDLGSGSHRMEALRDTDLQKYLLGSGLAARIYHDEMEPSLDPLDARSPLLAFGGLLTGTFSPTACRSSWCGRSPLTGIWNESNMGGHWGAELRFSGFDGLVVTGRSPEPAYLWIRDGEIEIRPAAHLWGKEQYETFDQVRAETDPKAQVASIGPAGERLIPFAGILQGGQQHSRTAGRGGMGAVLGSKNLKAIAVRGTDKPRYPDTGAFQAFVRETNRYVQANSVGLSQLGSAGGVIGTELMGDLALKNWTLGTWKDEAARISGQRIAETIFEKHTHCFACPIGCGKLVRIDEGPYAGVFGHGPEYETLAGFGGNCLCDDLNAIAHMNDLCNRLGLDTISTSAVIAFAMEAYEKGILSPEDAGGLELTWGNAEAMIACIHAIARQEGIGLLLAGGVRAAAARLGPEAETFAIHVKGLELPYHDPRGFVSMAANYATSSRGACHLESLSYWPGYGIRWAGWFDPAEYDRHDHPGKAKEAVDFQDYMAVYNPLGLCKFMIKGKFGPQHTVDLLNAATAWGWSVDDLLATGERLVNLKRLINLRLGMKGSDDRLPVRLLTEPRPSGSSAGVLPDLDRQIQEYYALRGWTPDGVPTQARLRELGL